MVLAQTANEIVDWLQLAATVFGFILLVMKIGYRNAQLDRVITDQADSQTEQRELRQIVTNLAATVSSLSGATASLGGATASLAENEIETLRQVREVRHSVANVQLAQAAFSRTLTEPPKDQAHA